MELSKAGWGKSRTTYDFTCVCGHVIIKDEKKAKERLERLHLTKCEVGRTAVATGQVVSYWNDAVYRQGGLRGVTSDSTDGGRPIVPPNSILNNQLR